MFSYPRRLKSGHLTCYLNRTYHVLTTQAKQYLDKEKRMGQNPPNWNVFSALMLTLRTGRLNWGTN
jgi:hypothetical protein